MNTGACQFKPPPPRGRGKVVGMAVARWKVMIHPYVLVNSFPPRSLFPSLLRPASTPAFLSAASSQRIRSMATSTGDGRCNQVEQHDLESIFKEKRLLRSKIRKALKSMDPVQRSREDDAIQQIVLNAPWFRSSRRLCAYISCSALREVNTSKLLSELMQNPAKDSEAQVRKKVYVPRVEDKNCHMRMFHISSIDDLIANSMNILEPAPVDAFGVEREDVMLANEPVDLFILPGLAFDRSGRRLGRGGGYYDTFLRNYQDLAKANNWKQPLLVALSYSVQIIDDGVVPITAQDLPIDALVSPSGVIPFSPIASERMKR